MTGVLIERAGPSRSQPAHALSAAAEAAPRRRPRWLESSSHEWCAPVIMLGQKKNDERVKFKNEKGADSGKHTQHCINARFALLVIRSKTDMEASIQ